MAGGAEDDQAMQQWQALRQLRVGGWAVAGGAPGDQRGQHKRFAGEPEGGENAIQIGACGTAEGAAAAIIFRHRGIADYQHTAGRITLG